MSISGRPINVIAVDECSEYPYIPDGESTLAIFRNPDFKSADTEAFAMRAWKVSLKSDNVKDPLKLVYFVKTRTGLTRKKSRNAAIIEAKRLHMEIIRQEKEKEQARLKAEREDFELMASQPNFGTF